MIADAIENSELLKIVFEKGLLAIVVLLAAFLLNMVLQRSRLRGEATNQIAADRSMAYIELWKLLSAVRPRDDEIISPGRVAQIESVLYDWYHTEAYALYMSWRTTKRYMQLRKTLQLTPIDSDKIRKGVSSLRTQLKVDCGVYSSFDALRQLPRPKIETKKIPKPES